MTSYWPEFLKVALAHLLAAASPGPDFAIVLRQSVLHGRRTGVWTALGVGAAICLHVTYSLFGVGVLVKSSVIAFESLKYFGAAYLVWLGIQGLRAKPRSLGGQPKGSGGQGEADRPPSAPSAWRSGFMVNALNPKVTLFFIALFAALISPTTPKGIQACYGLWIILATTAWFSFVAHVFTRENVRAIFLAHGHWIDRALGVVFIAFAVALVAASLR